MSRYDALTDLVADGRASVEQERVVALIEAAQRVFDDVAPVAANHRTDNEITLAGELAWWTE